MHRITSQPPDSNEGPTILIEQPPGPAIFFSSASTDIATISQVINENNNEIAKKQIRALGINDLSHPAQIDHYLSTTAKDTSLIIVRLLGGRNHWPYGLEQLQLWQKAKSSRDLIIFSGTDEYDNELNILSSISLDIH